MLKKKPVWIVFILLAVATKIFSLFPDAVERYYSNGLYIGIARLQRILFGWLPISIGDLLYTAIVVYLIYKLVDLIRRLIKRKTGKAYWWGALRRLVFSALLVYVVFNVFWGLNYNRLGIAYQLQLPVEKVNKEDLAEVMQLLLTKVNYYDTIAHQRRPILSKSKNIFRESVAAYDALEKKNELFAYPTSSIKPSLFSYIGNYLGYTGYYNPFTGEAQVNTTVPLFIQPFTTCHEIGHQLGYAKENEANFAGFLSARSSTDPNFLYSVYYELYSYGRPFLYLQDTALLKKLDAQLQPDVKKDFKELRSFYLRYENPIEKVIDKLYGQYLKANQQPSGKVTYSEVILWLVAYYRKYGAGSL